MVFDLSDTLMDYIPGSKQESEVLRCVNNILTGFFEGNLLVTCSPKFIYFFTTKIQAPDALTALNYLNRISTTLVYNVTYRIVVVFKEQDSCARGELSYQFFQKTESIQPTTFICEDLYDCKFYMLYTKEFLLNQWIKSSNREGGGGSVGKCLQEVKNNNIIALSIVDSDMHYKGAPYGKTARGAMNALSSNTTNIYLKVIDTLEAENLIPIGYIIKHCKNKKNEKFFRRLFTNHYGNEWRYYDLKEGVKVSSVLEEKEFYKHSRSLYGKLCQRADFDTYVKNYTNALKKRTKKSKVRNQELLPCVCPNILNQYITYLSYPEDKRQYIAYDKEFDKMDPLYKERKDIIDLVYAFMCVREPGPIN